MTKDERLALFRSTLEPIVGGTHGEFTSFTDKATDRFVQFSPAGVRHLVAESTDATLSKDDVARIPKSYDSAREENYTRYTSICDLDKAVELAEQFFRDICQLPDDFEPGVDTETGTGEAACDLCGCTLGDPDPEPAEMYLGEADALGFKKDVVADLVRASVDTVRSGRVVPDDEIDATCDSVAVDGPVFPILCSDCLEKLENLRRGRRQR